jgi:uncharacterized protein YciI
MWYAIFSEDVDNSLPLRELHRPSHLERLKSLAKKKRLLIAGPHPIEGDEGYSGSLVVIDFESAEQAQKWADEDPFVIHGVYKKVTVKPYTLVLSRFDK